MQYRVVAADRFSTHRQLLWDLSYRITGTVADADMLLRECFANAVDRPLIDREADWRPHLLRSAVTLAMDALRQRKRRRYVGSWLPSPIETGNAASPGSRPGETSRIRYDMVESGSFAFLRALEMLEPRERAAFVMGDAFGFELHETAMALELTVATVRTLLQSARRKMQPYDSSMVPPTMAAQAAIAAVLRDCLLHLQNYDAPRLEKILMLDARAVFDSGGEFVAPSADVTGAAGVARLLTRFANGTRPIGVSFRMLNGLPAALVHAEGRPRWAKRFMLRVEARDGLVSEIQVILATAKLIAVRFDPV